MFPSPGDLPDPGMEPASLVSLALTGGFFTTSATWEVPPIQTHFSTSVANAGFITLFPFKTLLSKTLKFSPCFILCS